MGLFTLGARLAADARRLATTIKVPRDEALREIRRMAAHALHLTHAQLIARERESPGRFDLSAYGIVFDRRLRGEPLAYVLGEWPFRDHVFRVSPDVLIPRSDTEGVVGAALNVCGEEDAARILDLGTGSGCIAISIALARPRAQIVAVDASADALAVALSNAERLSAGNVAFLESDWFSALGGMTFHLIVANPPYLAEDDRHLEALRFEPTKALVSGPDGLDALRVVIKESPRFLEPGGSLIVEHGFDQQSEVRRLFSEAGFGEVEGGCDLAGRPRFVFGQMANRPATRSRKKGSAVSV